MARKSLKMRRKRKRLTKFEAWKICQLGKFGGFAHRYIASQVFGKQFGRVTDSDIARVSSCLHRNEVRVTDWRQGKTAQSVQFAVKMGTPKKRLLKLLAA